MSNIIPFESGNLPAHLQGINAATLNADLSNGVSGGGFPIISIKGKVFTLVRGDNREVLPNPKDPESPATSIDVVIVKANKGVSKVFYAAGYSESGDAKKPDCFSNNGEAPDASVKSPQSKQCSTCKHNQWGSRTGEAGGKGKACQDSRRIALAAPGQINDPMLLRVPPASLKALAEYGDLCAKRGVHYSAVVTKLGFDMESPTPRLTFKPVGFLDDTGYAQVQQIAAGDIVKNILGSGAVVTEVEANDVPQIQVAKPAPVAETPKPKAAPAKEVDVGDLNLDDLNFDD